MRGTSTTPSDPSPKASSRPVDAARAATRSGVMIVYSHRDRDLLGELQVHLKPLQKAWMLDLWDDLRVDSGERGEAELRRAIAATRVALLLVSPSFVASEFITSHTLPVLLAAQEHPRAAVMCLYLRPTLDVFAEYKFVDTTTKSSRSVGLTSFHGLNDPMQPLAGLDKLARHQVLQVAAEEIIKAAHRNTVVTAAQ